RVPVAELDLVEYLLHRGVALCVEIQQSFASECKFSRGSEFVFRADGYLEFIGPGLPEIQASRLFAMIHTPTGGQLHPNLVDLFPGIGEFDGETPLGRGEGRSL